MIRIAAAGDIHCGADERTRVLEQFATVAEEADMLVLAGDLTNLGTLDEMACLASQLGEIARRIPVAATFGNHDVHSGQMNEARAILTAAGIRVIEKDCALFEVKGLRIGVAGAKGFGGGFRGGCAGTFGEPEMRAFLAPTFEYGAFFESALRAMDADIRLALMHYAPIPETLLGERWELFPFLGAYQLGDALDASGADLAFHGHAHRGTEYGETPHGVQVRNVAQAVLGKPYGIYRVSPRHSRRQLALAEASRALRA